MPPMILELTEKYLHAPVHVRISPKQLTVGNIRQFYIEVREESKLEVLCRLIEAERIHLALVFCNTRRKVDEVCEKQTTRGMLRSLHGDMKRRCGPRAESFREGAKRSAGRTDVAAGP
jgi:ATP-dependent RNA helicase DeaD